MLATCILKLNVRRIFMKLSVLIAVLLTLALVACGKPTAPDSPDESTYGQTIKPDHNVPDEHQGGY
jgi:hypothetical protein